MTTALLLWGFRERKKGADSCKRLLAKIKCSGFGSKFHMNAFPFSLHYDGNGPYHSICFALELSLVIYVPRVQIFQVSVQAKLLLWRKQGVFWRMTISDPCIRVLCMCGEALVAVPVCDRSPLAWEQRLERLPSRVAFVW